MSMGAKNVSDERTGGSTWSVVYSSLISESKKTNDQRRRLGWPYPKSVILR